MLWWYLQLCNNRDNVHIPIHFWNELHSNLVSTKQKPPISIALLMPHDSCAFFTQIVSLFPNSSSQISLTKEKGNRQLLDLYAVSDHITSSLTLRNRWYNSRDWLSNSICRENNLQTKLKQISFNVICFLSLT